MKQSHKHAEVIKAWADGEQIEFRANKNHEWTNVGQQPCWFSNMEYRIKPEPKPDITKAFLLENHCFAGFRFTEEYEHARLPRQQWIRAVFDGETGQIKSVEVLHE